MITKLNNYSVIIENGICSKVEKSDKTQIFLNNNGKEQVLSFKKGSGYLCKGLKDTHGHILGLGIKLLELNLEQAESIEECLFLCSKYISKYGLKSEIGKNTLWLIGRGWNEEKWVGSKVINKSFLDDYFPSIAVGLTRVDGHAMWVNSKTLEICNINTKTENITGGEIQKDELGNLTGLLIDNAMEIVKDNFPKRTKEEIKFYILTAIDDLISVGLTEIGDMDVSLEVAEAFIELDKANLLKIKVKSFIAGYKQEWKKFAHLIKPENTSSNNFIIEGVKFYADGALGSRGAYLLENYSDSHTRGLLFLEEEEFISNIKEIVKLGLTVATHAIGDAANRFVLNTYSRFREESKDYTSKLRIEHSQIVHPDDLQKFNLYNISTTIQPTFCKSDFDMAQSRLCNRVSYAYPWRALINNHIQISGSSDFPIEEHNPMFALEYLTSRKDFFDINKLSEENLPSNLVLPLYNIGNEKKYLLDLAEKTEEELINEFVINKPANFSIFSKNTLSPENKCITTIVNGKVVYQI